MKVLPLILFIALVSTLSCRTPAEVEEGKRTLPASTTTSVGLDQEIVPIHTFDQPGERPRFDRSGQRLVFHRGEAGKRTIAILALESGQVMELQDMKSDNRDPAFSRTGEDVFFSSDRDGSYDIYRYHLATHTLEKITELAEDALHAAPSPHLYRMYHVYDDGCGPPSGFVEDLYEKVAFTKVVGGDQKQVHFVSVQPRDTGDVEKASAHAAHLQRLSPDGVSCSHPAYSLNGLQLAYTCGDKLEVVDARATWELTFEDAVKTLRQLHESGCDDYELSQQDYERCVQNLPRRYMEYPGESVGSGQAIGYSTNHLFLIGDKEGQAVLRSRVDDEPAWRPWISEDEDLRNLVWSPTGKLVAFDRKQGSERMLAWAPTNFYLQEVENLDLFAEFAQQPSALMQESRFAVVPSDEKEFFALYEKLRYERRPQYITADAVLQVFRDEFVRAFETAEGRASDDLKILAESLMQSFSIAQDPSQRYLGVYFGVIATILRGVSRAQRQRPQIDPYDFFDPDAEAGPSLMDLLPDAIREEIANVPASLRVDVAAYVEAILRAEGIGSMKVPGFAEPFPIDWTQFRVRGNYTTNDLAGYFLAMMWTSRAPLPVDASLVALLQHLEDADAALLSRWQSVDSVVGSFMGRPVDATISHLVEARNENPQAFEPFNTKKVVELLEEKRGPIRIRDIASLQSQSGTRLLRLMLFPQRVGLDTEFFRELVHPEVNMRPFPSALDAFAALEVERAKAHAVAAFGQEYEAALEKIMEDRQGALLENTDLYHSWLAVLSALARAHQVDEAPLHDFTKTPAWADRLLSSALAGYTQLKHSAVLYAAQDMSAECGGGLSSYGFVERPVLPTPRGAVEPIPTFFEALSSLFERVYHELEGSDFRFRVQYRWDREPIHGGGLAKLLGELARKEVETATLGEEDLQFIEFFGALLESIALGGVDPTQAIQMNQDRAERGVLIATDIHTNVDREQVLQLGIGFIDHIYVAVPNGVAQTMTQGGVFSFYEFTHPMSKRLTDADWFELIQSEQAPSRPDWTGSFVQTP